MLKLKKTIRKNRKGQAGFTLLDLAVSMIVIGLIGAGFMATYKLYAESKAWGNTNSSFTGIKIAMDNYYYENNAYPCPADITLSADDAEYGRAAVSCVTPGVLFVTGGLPFKDLDLPMQFAIDGWKNKFTYTVSTAQTDPLTFAPDAGELLVTGVDETGATVTYAPNGSGFNAHYVIVSHGDDGAGAYSVEGGLVPNTACPDASQPRQNENCDADVTFFNNAFAMSKESGSNYYDDLLLFTTDMPSRIWVEQQNGQDIVTGVSIGIGTRAPSVALDVAGNILADGGNVLADRVCEQNNDDNCFEPDLIGGSGFICPSGIRGIRDGQGICVDTVSTSVIPAGSCPSGQYVVGINGAGGLICN